MSGRGIVGCAGAGGSGGDVIVGTEGGGWIVKDGQGATSGAGFASGNVAICVDTS